MCLAVPPNSTREQHYALPFTFTDIGGSSTFAAAAGQSFSAQASGEYGACHQDSSQMAQQQQQFATSANCNYFQLGTTCSTFDIPSTPIRQASGSTSFDFGLAPTGISPMLSAIVTTAGGPPNASSAMAAAAPLFSMPTKTLHSRKPTVAKRRRRGPQRPGKTATHKERLFVQHNYHDLALEPDMPRDGTSGNNSKASSSSSSTKKSSPCMPIMSECFPVKLHRILEETDAAGQSHIISWSPHGRAFKIHNPNLFTAQIMPHYFPKMKKLTSLQRQFNLYGFERLTRDGPDGGAYYHEAFLRYRPGLSAQRMFRRRVKGTGYKAASNPDAEPDLYAVKSMYEVMGSMKTNEELVSAAMPTTNITTSCGQQQQQQMTQPVVQYLQEQVESALVHKQAAVQVMGSMPSFYPVLGHSSSVVTQSTRAPSFTSQSTRESTTSESSSSEAQPHCLGSPQDQMYSYQQNYNQWNNATSSSSSMIAQAPMSNNFAMMPVQQQVQQQQQPQVEQEDSYDRFFSSLNEPPQDSFLREFFGSNDVTPMAPGLQHQQQQQQQQKQISQAIPVTLAPGLQNQQQQQISQAPPPAVVNNTARTTTTSTGIDQGILMEFADLWENATSRVS